MNEGTRNSKGIIIFLFILIQSFHLSAQDIQWASHIIGYSSQFANNSYSSKQILGEPQRIPGFGDCGCAWMPDEPDNRSEYVKVGFKKPIEINRVFIFENYNAGAIEKVYAYDQLRKEHEIYSNKKPEPLPVHGRMLTIDIKKTNYKVNAIKVVLKPSAIPGYNQIDAIGISGNKSDFTPQVNTNALYSKATSPESLGNEINSEFTEVMPRISPDGNTFYFDRKDHPDNYGGFINDDIWFSRKSGKNSWSEAINIGIPLNNANHNFVCGISEDGAVMTLANKYHRNGSSSTGISQSIFMDGRWIAPLNLEIDGYYSSNFFTEYYMTPDRKVLLIAATRWDSNGKNDLFVSFSDDMLTWSDPENMGVVINSPGTEMAPFMSADLEYLYFSTDALPGYGSQDIYISKRLDDTWLNWSAPENLGPDINSDAWDSHFIIAPDDTAAYFASNRVRYSDSDILTFDIFPRAKPKPEPATKEIASNSTDIIENQENEHLIEPRFNAFEPEILIFGNIFNKNNGQIISGNVSFAWAEDTLQNMNATFLNKRYKMQLRESAKYRVMVSSEGFYKHEAFVELEVSGKNKVKRLDFNLKPINKGDIIELKNIQFDANSAWLKSSSWKQLDSIVVLMNDNPALIIEVGGHTNDKCAEDFCKKLSESRATEVTKYLASKGIKKHRITPVGYGKTQPISDNKTKAGRMVNQRVEIKIIE